MKSIIAIWLVSGWSGSYLIWNDWVTSSTKSRCPSPAAILLGFVGGILGLGLLLAGIIIWFCSFQERDSWWTRPICKDRNP